MKADLRCASDNFNAIGWVLNGSIFGRFNFSASSLWILQACRERFIWLGL
jgi:hypothetical protein